MKTISELSETVHQIDEANEVAAITYNGLMSGSFDVANTHQSKAAA